MKTINQYDIPGLLFMAGILVISLSACSKQNWYHGAQSAQTAHCMKQPLSDYEDCNQPSNESYHDYKNSHDILNEKNESN